MTDEEVVEVPLDALTTVMQFVADDPALDTLDPSKDEPAQSIKTIEENLPEGAYWKRYADGGQPRTAGDRWAETTVDREGVSTTLYEQSEDGNDFVIDEWWASWADLIEHEDAWPAMVRAQNGLVNTTVTLDGD